MLEKPVLVLNKGYQAVNVIDARRAFIMLYAELALALDSEFCTHSFDTWSLVPISEEDDAVGTSSGLIKIPRVMVLMDYNKLPRLTVRYSRRNVFMRDRYTCQYCGKTRQEEPMNIDHVVPRAQGGTTQWENVVCSCVRCNSHKGARTPEQAHMKLARLPRAPDLELYSPYLRGNDVYPEWRPFLPKRAVA